MPKNRKITITEPDNSDKEFGFYKKIIIENTVNINLTEAEYAELFWQMEGDFDR